jgi:hypothetical protein
VATKKTARDHFDDVVTRLKSRRGTIVPSGGSGFGKAAQRADGKVFAMLVRDES